MLENIEVEKRSSVRKDERSLIVESVHEFPMAGAINKPSPSSPVDRLGFGGKKKLKSMLSVKVSDEIVFKLRAGRKLFFMGTKRFKEKYMVPQIRCEMIDRFYFF